MTFPRGTSSFKSWTLSQLIRSVIRNAPYAQRIVLSTLGFTMDIGLLRQIVPDFRCQQIFMTRQNNIHYKTLTTTDTFLISIIFEMESQLSISIYIKERSGALRPHMFTGDLQTWFCFHHERAPPHFGQLSSKTSGCFWSDLLKQIPGDRCNRRSDRWQEFHP